MTMDGSPLVVPAASPVIQKRRALVVSSVFTEDQTVEKLGREAYSYRFVFRAFAPLMQRWGQVLEITRPESRLDYALWRARQQNLEPMHFSFLPLHMMYLAQQAPNIAAPAWEFPDIPDTDFDNNPRNNWARIANRLDLIVAYSQFIRDAMLRAGVKTPIRVVPVPISAAYFSVPDWRAGQRAVIDCPSYVFPQPEESANSAADPWAREKITGLSLRARGRHVYRAYIKRRLPRRLDKCLNFLGTAVGAAWKVHTHETRIAFAISPKLDLSGVVYTTIFNPFDPRKNWQDLLSAYLLALGDCADATLVVKLVVCPELTAAGLNSVVGYYRSLGLNHRCKLVFVTNYLSDSQMVELARASTYYVNASHAEGACLPLQDFMAAGRPGIAPAHTAMAEYVSDDVGFVVASHPEPACWPHDPQRRITTTWHRLVWWSLHEQLRASYDVAKQDRRCYLDLGAAGRERVAAFAGPEQVWTQLQAALNSVLDGTSRRSYATTVRKAS